MSEKLISDLIDKGACELKNYISEELCTDLYEHAQSLIKQSHFQQAKVGRGLAKNLQQEIRGDQIFWIDDWSLSPFSRYGEILEQLRLTLRKELFLPIKRFEGHLALYQQGAFYLPHIDRHQNQPHRLISTVLYLNDVKVGGELVIQTRSGVVEVRPHRGTLVVFESDLTHEVRPTDSPRLSLTSWLRDDVL
jgi:SM-20-related protein